METSGVRAQSVRPQLASDIADSIESNLEQAEINIRTFMEASAEFNEHITVLLSEMDLRIKKLEEKCQTLGSTSET